MMKMDYIYSNAIKKKIMVIAQSHFYVSAVYTRCGNYVGRYYLLYTVEIERNHHVRSLIVSFDEIWCG